MFKASVHIARTVLANALRMASDRLRPKEERSAQLDALIAEEKAEMAKLTRDDVKLSPKAKEMIAEGIAAATDEDIERATKPEKIGPLPGSLAWRAQQKQGATR